MVATVAAGAGPAYSVLSVRFSSSTGHTRFVPVKHFSFQSAFHRGNGCYGSPQIKRVVLDDFQSAFHRGNGCYKNMTRSVVGNL